jgi:hypothetical protein
MAHEILHVFETTLSNGTFSNGVGRFYRSFNGAWYDSVAKGGDMGASKPFERQLLVVDGKYYLLASVEPVELLDDAEAAQTLAHLALEKLSVDERNAITLHYKNLATAEREAFMNSPPPQEPHPSQS